MAGRVAPRVLVASDDAALLDEIVRHLEELPHWRIGTSVRNVEELNQAIATQAPEAVLISDGLARDLAAAGGPQSPPGGPHATPGLIVVGRQEHTDTYKAALKLGARGFVAWPQDRQQLRALVERDLKMHRRSANLGELHAVWSPKGGSGASVLAAHFASALTRVGARCTLVDLDIEHGDQSAILGAEGENKTLVELLRVGDELVASMVGNVVWTHADGFKVVLSPGASGEAEPVKAPAISRVLVSVREGSPHVIADVASGINEISLAMFEEASTLLMVVTPDYLSLKRCRDALKIIRSSGLDTSRCALLLNQWSDPDVTEQDAQAVLGLPVAATIRSDVHLYKSSSRKELSEFGKAILEPLARKIIGLPDSRRGWRERVRGASR